MKKKKTFRLNVVIHYWEGVCPANYRQPLLDLLRSIAWLHALDYAIVEHNPFEPVTDSDTPHNKEPVYADLIYFRSTAETKILIKELRTLINMLGSQSSLFSVGVDMGYQLQKALREYPFPEKYYRQSNYPYIEEHHNGDIKTLLHVSAIRNLDIPL